MRGIQRSKTISTPASQDRRAQRSSSSSLKRGLIFSGIQKTTLVDFPGKVASTLFLSGCNFRCGYCYNPDLVLSKETGVSLSDSEALGFLSSRKSFLDGVCVSGGEPLLHFTMLKKFLKEVKSLDLLVKLDTNGSFPNYLSDLLNSKLVDYVAMDIKGPLERYPEIVRVQALAKDIKDSVDYVRTSGCDYELRTTVDSDLSLDEVEKIGKWLQGSKRYFLQPLKKETQLLEPDYSSFKFSPTREHLEQLANRLRKYIPEVSIRP